VTARTGLQKFHHVSGSSEKRYILESPSGGVALLDYDNDGWLDIYLVNGSTLPALAGRRPPARPSSQQSRRNIHRRHHEPGPNERWGFGGPVTMTRRLGRYLRPNFGKNRLYTTIETVRLPIAEAWRSHRQLVYGALSETTTVIAISTLRCRCVV
jgi:hypothetical protein